MLIHRSSGPLTLQSLSLQLDSIIVIIIIIIIIVKLLTCVIEWLRLAGMMHRWQGSTPLYRKHNSDARTRTRPSGDQQDKCVRII
jgi:hypothetical protein